MRFWSRHLAALQYRLRYATLSISSDCRKILCYGDSNTWGFTPGGGHRFGPDVRWPRVLQSSYGPGAIVYEEGLCGRTLMWDDPQQRGRNGRRTLMPILRHYAPLDVVVLVLGTNDLKSRFNLSAAAIADGAGKLCEDIQRSNSGRAGNPPEVLLVSPPPITQLTSAYRDDFDGAVEKSKLLSTYFADIAANYRIQFLDAAKSTSASGQDPIHWDAASHQAFGRVVAKRLNDFDTFADTPTKISQTP